VAEGLPPFAPPRKFPNAEGLLRLILNRGCGKQQRGGPHALDAERRGEHSGMREREVIFATVTFTVSHSRSAAEAGCSFSGSGLDSRSAGISLTRAPPTGSGAGFTRAGKSFLSGVNADFSDGLSLS
jgi:hypothetical protein